MSNSAFKTLFTDMVHHSGDFSKLSRDIKNQMLKVFVKETQPYFLVSDSFFFVPAYFTRSALDEFEKKFPNVKVQDLQEKVILINNWSLELKKVDSNAVFTSYAGLEVRLVVHSFKPQLSEKLHPTRWPTNLYRDDEFKTTIQALRHQAVVEAAGKIASQDPALVGKGDVSANIVSSKGDDWNFKEGSTPVVTLGTGKKPAAASGAAKVKGVAAKRAVKAASKMSEDKKKKMPATARTVEKVMKFTPGKKQVTKGKQSTSGKKPAASPGGKKSAVGTTDQMTMQTLKKFIQYQKGGRKAATVLGKKPANGKKSATK
jgi:hypothetical protein